ncbi:Flagellar biosynthesis protein, FliO [Pseudovibrio axinellae]|uniref:Flagellar biosynthesis protein, FliO n=1 Tax=Pseudovibrio axinellae TaxID=989403 RepID=A0A166ANC2_9HYPH|nr:flagellar biosynthetic protein FliO [Pseudovibrio axinellae]KZL21341.1 Flagellar biosynthesis protein, FliO [Pseudovibrio axinellae]SEQ96790.1 Flagellar biosynthesis protein, FliO [Pseudovibrio axinellae]
MPDWLAKTTGASQGTAQFLAVVLALLIIVVLIAVCIPLLKRLARTSYKGSRSRQPRLAIMDATDIDARRRLLLVRRDNVEHLILIGGANDVVVEQGIIRGVPVSAPSRGQAFAGAAQTEPNQSGFEQGALPTEPSAALNWGTQATTEPTPPKPAPTPRAYPEQSMAAKTPAPKAMAAQTAAATPLNERSAPAAQPAQARPIRPAAPAPIAQATKPGALQTPTIGGARPVQKVAARPITARPAPLRSQGFSPIKPLATSAEPKAPEAEKTGPAPVAQRATTPAAIKPTAPAAITPPLSGPAANAKSAFLRPRVNEAKAKPQEEKKEEHKPAPEKPAPQKEATAKAAAKAETAPAPAKEQKPETKPEIAPAPAKEQKAEPVKAKENTKAKDNRTNKPDTPKAAPEQAKPKEASKKPEPTKAAAKKNEKTPPKETKKEAVVGIEKEMADLLDDIEANTK